MILGNGHQNLVVLSDRPIEIEQVGVAIGCGFYYSTRGHNKVKVKKANLILQL